MNTTSTTGFWVAFDQVFSLWPLILGIVLAAGLVGLLGWSVLGLVRPSKDTDSQAGEDTQPESSQGDV